MEVNYVPVETITDIDIIHCIEAADRKAENIYIVDEQGDYTGKAVVVSQMVKLWENDFSCVVDIPGLDKADLKDVWHNYPHFDEIPILQGKKVVAAISKKIQEKGECKPRSSARGAFYKVFSKGVKIYLSSIENEELYAFYKLFNKEYPWMQLLTSENVYDVLSDSNSILIYDRDVFPSCNKINIYELWERLMKESMDELSLSCYIDNRWAQINEREKGNLPLIIEKFDSGFHTISIVDDEENFVGAMLLATFQKDFPKKKARIWDDLFCAWMDDEIELRKNVASAIKGTARRELPIVKNRKIVASGFMSYIIIQNQSKNDVRDEFEEVHWELISDSVAQKFFGRGIRNVLISSDSGVLYSFKKRFENLVHISVYSSNLHVHYLNGEFDVVVYRANVWNESPVPAYDVIKLYFDMLAEEVRRYLQKNGILYSYVDILDKPEDIKYRIDYHRNMIPGATFHDGKYLRYVTYEDVKSKNINIINGIRLTTDNPHDYRKTIYFFGPCTPGGVYVNDSQTIESYLQQIVNKYHADVRVLNFSNPGWGFNSITSSLYHMIETNLREGDIVIHFGFNMWESFPEEFANWRFSVKEITSDFVLLKKKIFTDTMMPGHLNADGNRMVAEFLWRKLKDVLVDEDNTSTGKSIPSFIESLTSRRFPLLKTKSKDFEQYLAELKEYRVTANTIGAIVMNCNPFTKGHRYLIETALSQVDFLYVFVVQEDQSAIKFADRFAMVETNCQRYRNIKVLPSGKYMISQFTFAEYFNKEKLQSESIVIPEKDVALFGREIAPCLNIRKRFVGEEPFDAVTRQYNEVMSDMLPSYGVELIVVPRLRTEQGEMISATKVRDLIKKGNIESALPYLTTETYSYILQKGGDIIE